MVRSKLDYDYLKILDTVHHQGLRLALGAFRTSPIPSLYVEADEPSLSERRVKLSLQYITKLKSNPTNPAYECVFEPMYTTLSGVYCRQDETVLRRCRIGHTFYTHSYILKGEDRPRCVGCDEDITVKHILLDCVDFSDQRPRFYSSSNLKHLFTQVPGHQMLSF